MSKFQKVERMLKYAEGSFKWLLHSLVSTVLFIIFDITYLGNEALYLLALGFAVVCAGGLVASTLVIRKFTIELEGV